MKKSDQNMKVMKILGQNIKLVKISDQNIGQEGKVVAVESDKHNIGSNTNQTSTNRPHINL